jgi:hypothetical protein
VHLPTYIRNGEVKKTKGATINNEAIHTLCNPTSPQKIRTSQPLLQKSSSTATTPPETAPQKLPPETTPRNYPLRRHILSMYLKAAGETSRYLREKYCNNSGTLLPEVCAKGTSTNIRREGKIQQPSPLSRLLNLLPSVVNRTRSLAAIYCLNMDATDRTSTFHTTAGKFIAWG